MSGRGGGHPAPRARVQWAMASAARAARPWKKAGVRVWGSTCRMRTGVPLPQATVRHTRAGHVWLRQELKRGCGCSWHSTTGICSRAAFGAYRRQAVVCVPRLRPSPPAHKPTRLSLRTRPCAHARSVTRALACARLLTGFYTQTHTHAGVCAHPLLCRPPRRLRCSPRMGSSSPRCMTCNTCGMSARRARRTSSARNGARWVSRQQSSCVRALLHASLNALQCPVAALPAEVVFAVSAGLALMERGLAL